MHPLSKKRQKRRAACATLQKIRPGSHWFAWTPRSCPAGLVITSRTTEAIGLPGPRVITSRTTAWLGPGRTFQGSRRTGAPAPVSSIQTHRGTGHGECSVYNQGNPGRTVALAKHTAPLMATNASKPTQPCFFAAFTSSVRRVPDDRRKEKLARLSSL